MLTLVFNGAQSNNNIIYYELLFPRCAYFKGKALRLKTVSEFVTS